MGFRGGRGRIGALGLGKRVLCPGAIADQDLPSLYQGAIALVHPSRYEGFGLQLVEAMASGVPVLASRNHKSARGARRLRVALRSGRSGFHRAPDGTDRRDLDLRIDHGRKWPPEGALFLLAQSR